jgi:hypothetical protein
LAFYYLRFNTAEKYMRCTLKMNKKQDTMQRSGVSELNMTIPGGSGRKSGHELGDCVQRMSWEQMWFGGWNLWGWVVALSLLNCDFLHIAVVFC